MQRRKCEYPYRRTMPDGVTGAFRPEEVLARDISGKLREPLAFSGALTRGTLNVRNLQR